MRKKSQAAVLVAENLASGMTRSTIVLVQGAFDDTSSWNGVVAALKRKGCSALAASSPLRCLIGDVAHIVDLASSIAGPVVLVGHAYGAQVIDEAARHATNVKALVYVAALAPGDGEVILTKADTPPCRVAKGLVSPPASQDATEIGHLSGAHCALFAEKPLGANPLTRRPAPTDAPGAAPRGAPRKRPRSYAILGSEDRHVTPCAMASMIERTPAVETVLVEGATHTLMRSHPEEVAKLIADAASRP